MRKGILVSPESLQVLEGLSLNSCTVTTRSGPRNLLLPDVPGVRLAEPFTHRQVLFPSGSLMENIVPGVSLSFLFS